MVQPREIAIDFDGTIVKHEFPEIGQLLPGAVETIKLLQANGHKIYLWTMRSGSYLDEAVSFLKDVGIILDGVNSNPAQDWSDSPKCYANLYIDDAALGVPLKYNPTGRPYVDWEAVRDWFISNNYLPNMK